MQDSDNNEPRFDVAGRVVGIIMLALSCACSLLFLRFIYRLLCR